MLWQAFGDLQQQRHDADYDNLYDISARAALGHVRRADEALQALWQFQADREPGLILPVKLGFGGVKVARTR